MFGLAAILAKTHQRRVDHIGLLSGMAGRRGMRANQGKYYDDMA